MVTLRLGKADGYQRGGVRMAKSKKQIPAAEHTNDDHQTGAVQVIEEAPKPREFTP